MIAAPPIKKPCLERWEDMRGDNRTRLCKHCQLHVQNLSAMSRRDIGRVLSIGQVCVTYVRRADGGLVTRATLLREQCVAPWKRAFAYLVKALVPFVLALCRTPQKKCFLSTWRIAKPGRRADKADRITFKEDHSFVLVTSNGGGERRTEVHGSWCADEKTMHIWCEGRKHLWDIIELLPEKVRLKSNTRVVVYKRVGKTPIAGR